MLNIDSEKLLWSGLQIGYYFPFPVVTESFWKVALKKREHRTMWKMPGESQCNKVLPYINQ